MKESGQTFLLVTHNPDLVANFCTRGIVLEAGSKIFDGSTFEAIEVYKQIRTDTLLIAKNKSTLKTNISKQTKLEIDQADIALDGLTIIDSPTAKDISLITGQLIAKKEIENVTVNFSFRNTTGIVVCSYLAERSGFVIKKIKPRQVVNLEFQFSKRFLPGRYFVTFGINKRVGDVSVPLLLMQNFIYFDIEGDTVMGGMADFGMKVNLIE
jgi:ABC-type glutathione transport system ATPase component